MALCPACGERSRVTGIEECLDQAMAIPGARRVTMVDCTSGLAIAGAGEEDLVGRDEDAADTTEVVKAVLASPALGARGAGDDPTEIIVCGTAGYHLVTLVDSAPEVRLFLHLFLDRDLGNLALARHRIRGLIDALAES